MSLEDFNLYIYIDFCIYVRIHIYMYVHIHTYWDKALMIDVVKELDRYHGLNWWLYSHVCPFKPSLNQEKKEH
jgi:hypothetical protein